MNRREVVTLGVIGIGALCTGCGGGDAEPTPDAADGTGFEMCGANLCVNLAHASNAALATVNGARTINVPGDKLIIVRRTATTFAVLSRICTHNGCSVGFNATAGILQCPCHGSQFTLDGAVARDPALDPIPTYPHVFDEAAQLLTIMLA
jgi:cytochrome b6-f complex iron-sulfur subunit